MIEHRYSTQDVAPTHEAKFFSPFNAYLLCLEQN